MLPLWVHRLCDDFWRDAGGEEGFPRSLRPAIRRALPLTVVELPCLCTNTVIVRLRAKGLALFVPGLTDRLLRACLVAQCGVGFIFVERDDPDDERRFSLAHEVAHFLRHYLQPRREAERRLGAPILEVLDGRRSPTAGEGVHSLLHEVTIGCHVHFMHRGAGRSAGASVLEKEKEADLLAYHLLAPRDAVLASRVDPSALVGLLQDRFGLPNCHARRYAGLLVPPSEEDPVLRSLGLSRIFLSKTPPPSGTTREGE